MTPTKAEFAAALRKLRAEKKKQAERDYMDYLFSPRSNHPSAMKRRKN